MNPPLSDRMHRRDKTAIVAELVARFAAIGGIVMVFGAGCRHHEYAATGEAITTQQQTQTLADADAMVRAGRQVREQGVALRDQGKDGDELIKKGEQMMAEGQQKRADAMMMRTR